MTMSFHFWGVVAVVVVLVFFPVRVTKHFFNKLVRVFYLYVIDVPFSQWYQHGRNCVKFNNDKFLILAGSRISTALLSLKKK